MRSLRRPRAELQVSVDSELEVGAVETDRWGALARGVLIGEGIAGPAELTLTFVNVDRMTELNEEWMQEAGPTDVLAFPLDAEADALTGPGLRLLGDVVVCPDVAETYAAANGRSPQDELALLVVHGVLHVLGYDHAEPDEAEKMAQKERGHLRVLHDPSWSHTGS